MNNHELKRIIALWIALTTYMGRCDGFTTGSSYTGAKLLNKGAFQRSSPLSGNNVGVLTSSKKMIPMNMVKTKGEDMKQEMTNESNKQGKDIMLQASDEKKSIAKTGLNWSKALATWTLCLWMFITMLITPAWAIESGGRMGGSFSRQQQSYSSPPSRSYSGGSYSRGFSQGFGAGYMTRPPVVYAPSYSPFFNPFWGPRVYSPGVTVVSPGLPIGAIFTVGFIFASFFAFSSVFSSGPSSSSSVLSPSVSSALGSGTSVLKLSIALDVPRRDDSSSILSILNNLSQTARTDSRVGIQNLLSQVALSLLRQKQSIFGASYKYSHSNDSTKAQRNFNSWALSERSKFQRETVSKYGGVDYSTASDDALSPQQRKSSQATVAVVTLVLAIDGDTTKLPSGTVRSMQDVETILTRIASDSKVDSCLQSLEVLWTPEERTETLSRKDIFADYPNLRSV